MLPQRTLTEHQAKTILLALLGHEPRVTVTEDFPARATIDHMATSHMQAGRQLMIEIFATVITGADPPWHIARRNYQLLLGYYDTETRRNPGTIVLMEMENGEEFNYGHIHNLPFVNEKLREYGVWDYQFVPLDRTAVC